MKPNITLPNRLGIGDKESFSCDNNLVIIGANGSGKTRLGAWIEFNLPNITVHRISAQKALNIPLFATIKNLEESMLDLLYGRSDQYANVVYKLSSRWGDQPQTYLLNDYEKLLSTLFARSAKRNKDYTEEAKIRRTYADVPEAPIDIITRIWKEIMPQREILFDDGKVLAKKGGQPLYHGKEMSDGERVTLYLIGQCLCIPNNSIIIIDEPEIHLHKSIMARLWNKIEEVCSKDNLFVYITHDLDFAASRKDSKKVWVKSYNGEDSWIWDEIPEIEEIPENLTIEITGNPKNVIFCEGEKSSYDYILYQEIYPDYHIVPRGSSEKVIESVKAMRATPTLAHLKAYGIIDVDYRIPEEIDSLKGSGIYTIDVAEIENIFCITPLIKIVCDNQRLPIEEKIREVTALIIKWLKVELDNQITNRAEREIRYRLNTYTKDSNDEQGLKDGLDNLLKTIDINEIFSENKKLYEQVITEQNLKKALKIYKRKSLPDRISPVFGLANGEYIKIILRLLKSEKKKEIISAIRKYTPEINGTEA